MERLTTRDLAARTHLAPQTILNYVKEGTIHRLIFHQMEDTTLICQLRMN